MTKKGGVRVEFSCRCCCELIYNGPLPKPEGNLLMLVKSCKSTYHPTISNNIKIGTLYEYRQTENLEIVDREEGVLRFKLFLDGEVKVDPNWFNLFMGGGIKVSNKASNQEMPRFIGETVFHAETVNIVSVGANNLVLGNSRASIKRSSPDGYVFCMTMAESVDEVIGLFPSYDSRWSVGEGDIDKLASRLAELVLNECKHTLSSGVATLPLGLIAEDLSVEVDHRPVNYISRDMHFNSKNICSYAHLVSLLSDLCFIKPPEPYKKEKEYRFHFRVKCGETDVHPWSKSIYVNSESIFDIMK